MVVLMQIIRHQHILIWNHSFHGGYDAFLRHVDLYIIQTLFDIRRRNRQDNQIGLIDYFVDVRREMNTRHIKICPF